MSRCATNNCYEEEKQNALPQGVSNCSGFSRGVDLGFGVRTGTIPKDVPGKQRGRSSSIYPLGRRGVRSGPAGSIAITGSIHVGDHWFNGGKKAEVEEIEKNPPLQQSGNNIRIDYVNVQNIAIDYEITAPRRHQGPHQVGIRRPDD